MAVLKVYADRYGNNKYGVLSGVNTKDYSFSGNYKRFYSEIDGVCVDSRTWLKNKSDCRKFRIIRVEDDVKKIGDCCFAFFENCEFFFDKSDLLERIGSKAFMQSGISGILRLEGLCQLELGDAFQSCRNLVEVNLDGSAVQIIGKEAFMKCYGLERFIGSDIIDEIHEGAFLCCPKLEKVDLCRPKSVGEISFHICGVADTEIPFEEAADGMTAALRSQRYTADELREIRAVNAPDCVRAVPNTVDQERYPDVEYCRTKDANGQLTVTQYISDFGCVAVSLYHAYNMMFPGQAFQDFMAFWNHVDELSLSKSGKHIYEYEYGLGTGQVLDQALGVLGLTRKDYGEYSPMGAYRHDAMLTWDKTALEEIVWALRNGHGVIAEISKDAAMPISSDMALHNGVAIPAKTPMLWNTHAVAIVGYKDGKLVVVDSSRTNGDDGNTYLVAYEDLFVGRGIGEHPIAANDIMIIMKDGG